MKNPDSKMLSVVWHNNITPKGDDALAAVLAQLAIAESNLVRAGKDSAMPHFIALIKAIEDIYNFKFEVLPEANDGKVNS